MEIYLVGGAVRDELLHLPIHERDWVVVGSSPEEMLALGFQPVGKEFPVFLHPETKEEYALARTERKIAKGYKGFAFYASPNVTLEEDLKRRDLTINAMARSPDGQLIDPFGGEKDLQQKILRHVSPAFAEDPVRILRLARFAAKFTRFTIAPKTYSLMRDMVEQGEVDALVAERVWQEFYKALGYAEPKCFLEVLIQCNALPRLFPSLKISDEQLTAFAYASETTTDPLLRFACLFYHLPAEAIQKLCVQLRCPKEFPDLALLLNHHFLSYQKIQQSTTEDILLLLKHTDAIRRPKRFEKFLLAAEIFLTLENPQQQHLQKSLLEKAVRILKEIDIALLQQKNLKGADFATALHALQIQTLEQELFAC